MDDNNNDGVTSCLSLKLVDQRVDLVLHLLVLLLLVLHLALWRIWKQSCLTNTNKYID